MIGTQESAVQNRAVAFDNFEDSKETPKEFEASNVRNVVVKSNNLGLKAYWCTKNNE